MKPFVRSPYNYDTRKAALAAGLSIPVEEEDLTQQQFKDECDINVIMERFGVTRELPPAVGSPQYGDYDSVSDFQTALNAVRQAEESFMALPSKLRSKFHNDPQEFLEFVNDNANYEEAQRMGLVPPPAPVVKDTPPAPSAPPGGASTAAPAAS